MEKLQSDNGREYCNKQFNEYLKREGIQRRLTPQQNGVAECINRTIVDMARCLLIQSGLPTMYWGEAINTANYLRNRCPSRSHEGMTPFELWFGKVPNLKHLKLFGAKAFVLDKTPGRRKLDDKSIEGKFVGYSLTAKAYRIRLNDTGAIIETRDVKIVEEPTMRAMRDTSPINIDYAQPEERDFEPGRVIRDAKPCEKHEMAPPLWRVPGRPEKEKTGKPGRPKKLYRYVSSSGLASSRTPSRENLSQNEEPSQEHEEGEPQADVSDQEKDDENRGEKQVLETSLIPMRSRHEVTQMEETLRPHKITSKHKRTTSL